MKNKKFITLVLILSAVILMAAGCSSATQESTGDGGQNIRLTGLDAGEIAVSVRDIKALAAYSGRVKGADSQGNPVVFDIKGAYLADLLEQNGCSQSDLVGIRITASDGYSIEVPEEIVKTRDMILAYEMDGEPLDADNAPIRMFIPDERAMYWVRMVDEIELLYAVQSESVAGIYIVESLYDSGDLVEYMYAGQSCKALDTRKMINEYPGSGGDTVLMTASDGLMKNETVENFNKGAIDMTGDESPAFVSDELPVGMFVKKLQYFKYGGNAFYFIDSIYADGPVNLGEIAQACGLVHADTYVLHFADGTDKTIGAAALASYSIGEESGRVYVQQDGPENKFEGFVSLAIK